MKAFFITLLNIFAGWYLKPKIKQKYLYIHFPKANEMNDEIRTELYQNGSDIHLFQYFKSSDPLARGALIYDGSALISERITRSLNMWCYKYSLTDDLKKRRCKEFIDYSKDDGFVTYNLKYKD